MMPEWISNVLLLSGQKYFQKNLKNFFRNKKKLFFFFEYRTVKGTDPIFDRFKCPLFYKFIISLSGFTERDRNTIKQYLEREGATYSPNLIKDKCTHLICKEPKGKFSNRNKNNFFFCFLN